MVYMKVQAFKCTEYDACFTLRRYRTSTTNGVALRAFEGFFIIIIYTQNATTTRSGTSHLLRSHIVVPRVAAVRRAALFVVDLAAIARLPATVLLLAALVFRTTGKQKHNQRKRDGD